MDDFWDDISDVVPVSARKHLSVSSLNDQLKRSFEEKENAKTVSKVQRVPQINEVHDAIDSSDKEPERNPKLQKNKHAVINQNCLHNPNNANQTTSTVGRFKSIFPFPCFNPVQSSCFHVLFNTNDCAVITAPTGAGKTCLLELAVCQMLKNNENTCLALYVGPLKALCHERAVDWKEKFSEFNVNCKELTGDTKDNVPTNCNFIITTPEKWDSFTKNTSNLESIMKKLKLVMIDEIQHVGEHRGATLEAIVCRMKLTAPHYVRYIAVSATCPNATDIAQWLECESSNIFCFGEEFRPVRLTTIVKSYPPGKNQFLFQQNLKYKLFDVVLQYYDEKPTLVFCSTRKDTISCIQQFVKDSLAYPNEFSVKGNLKVELDRISSSIDDRVLKELITKGVAFYHAGLSHSDRNNVQKLFGDGKLILVCTTSSLSKGVNLPAHLVVILGTQLYNAGIYEELSIIDVLQMIGRAGRPQFDSHGTAVIMTSENAKQRYNDLVAGQELVESTLMSSIPTFLNTEIAIGTIRTIRQAQYWLMSTFLYRRILKNPQSYNIPSGLTQSRLESYLKEMLMFAVQDLKTAEMIKVKDDGILVPLDSGICMSRYSIAFDTMKLFQEIDRDDTTMTDIILVLSKATEFAQISLRRNEKNCLNQLHQSLKHKLEIQGKRKTKLKLIQSAEEKLFVLIQAVLGNLEIPEWSLKQEANQAITNLLRIMKGAISFFVNKPKKSVLVQLLLLNQSVTQRMWYDSLFVCKQIDKIGKKLCDLLVDRNITTLELFQNTDPRILESIMNRNIPFGNKTQEALRKIWPDISISIKVEGNFLNVKTLAKHPVIRNKFGIGNYSTLLITEEGTDNVLLVNHMIPNFAERPYETKINLPKKPILCQVFNNDFVGMNVERCFQRTSEQEDSKDILVRSESKEPKSVYEDITKNYQAVEPSPEITSRYSVEYPKERLMPKLPNNTPKIPILNYLDQQMPAVENSQIDITTTSRQQLHEERSYRLRLEQRMSTLEKKLDVLLERITPEANNRRSPCKPKIHIPANSGYEKHISLTPIPLHPEGRNTSKWYSIARNHSQDDMS